MMYASWGFLYKRGASNIRLDRVVSKKLLSVNAVSCEIPISTAYTGPLLLIPFKKVFIIFLHEKIEIFFKRF